MFEDEEHFKKMTQKGNICNRKGVKYFNNCKKECFKKQMVNFTTEVTLMFLYRHLFSQI